MTCQHKMSIISIKRPWQLAVFSVIPVAFATKYSYSILSMSTRVEYNVEFEVSLNP
jgi:hypothetical protein